MFFLQKEIWWYLKTKEKSRLRFQVFEAMDKSKVMVCTDLSKEELIDDELLFLVWNDSGGRISFDYNSKVGEYLGFDSTASLSSTFLLSSDIVFCKEKQQRQGVVVLNDNMLDNNPSFFEQKGHSIRTDLKYEKGWENKDICSVIGNHTCNSMIFLDAYICSQNISKNLKPLLRVLLPERLDIPFHLSIITQLNGKQLEYAEQLYQQIKKTVCDIKPHLKVHFTLFHSAKIHDRVILTNSYRIEVGAGFNLFIDGKAFNDTVVRYYPLKDGDYYHWLYKAAKICVNTNYYWGDKQNRLFDLVEDEHIKAKYAMASTKESRLLINTSNVPKVKGLKIVGKIDLPSDYKSRYR